MPDSPRLKVQIGLSSLPHQVQKRSMKAGYRFTLMVAGESGLGKSTLLNTLFQTRIIPPQDSDYEEIGAQCADESAGNTSIAKTVNVEARHLELEEDGVKLALTVMDMPGFESCSSADECWAPILKVVQDGLVDHLESESNSKRPVPDDRVHCCLYFLTPSFAGLRKVDIAVMKRIGKFVNLIPIIGKADTLTSGERTRLKQKINTALDTNGIRYYRAPMMTIEEADMVPFMFMPLAVVGATAFVDVEGKTVRGRKYPWGMVEVDNKDHCDLHWLQDILIRTHLVDLIASTNSLYEDFRLQLSTKRMSDIFPVEGPSSTGSHGCDGGGVVQVDSGMSLMAFVMKTVFSKKLSKSSPHHSLHAVDEATEAESEEARSRDDTEELASQQGTAKSLEDIGVRKRSAADASERQKRSP